MSTRSRHEARWTHKAATVTGRKAHNRPWVLLVLVAAIAVLATVGYVRFMGFTTVTYEFRQCQAPLDEQSDWSTVQAAACDPAPLDGAEIVLMRSSEAVAATRVDGSSLVWERWPLNSPEHSIEIELPGPARSVVIAEPEAERIRTELTKDASGTRWGGHIGGRGPTTYWILVTPGQG